MDAFFTMLLKRWGHFMILRNKDFCFKVNFNIWLLLIFDYWASLPLYNHGLELNLTLPFCTEDVRYGFLCSCMFVLFFVFVCLFVCFLICVYGLIFGFFRDRNSLYAPGCPGTHSVDHAGLVLRNLPTSASQVLGLKLCTTNTLQILPFLMRYF